MSGNHRRQSPRLMQPHLVSRSYDTTMSQAFLAGLGRWVAQHLNDPEATTVLPTGRANVDEVARVLRALNRARTTLSEQE